MDVLQIHNLGQWLAAWTFSSNFFGEGSLSTLILKVHFLFLELFFLGKVKFAMFKQFDQMTNANIKYYLGGTLFEVGYSGLPNRGYRRMLG